ncbi:MAG: hypothetical protein PVSMB2_23360 [Ktedonobacteraceae bacterium]
MTGASPVTPLLFALRAEPCQAVIVVTALAPVMHSPSDQFILDSVSIAPVFVVDLSVVVLAE